MPTAGVDAGAELDAGRTLLPPPVIKANEEEISFFLDAPLTMQTERWQLPSLPAASSWQIKAALDEKSSLFLMLHSEVNAQFIVEKVMSPSGEIWTSNDESTFSDAQFIKTFGFPAQVFSRARTLPNTGGIAHLLPNWSAEKIEAGIWTLNLKSYALAGDPSTKVPLPVELQGELWRKKKNDRSTKKLPLFLHFIGELAGNSAAGVANLNVNNAMQHAQFLQALSTLQNIYAEIGIELTGLSLDEISDESLQIVELDAATCGGNDLDRIFLASAESVRFGRERDIGLHFYFVERFSCIREGIDVGAGIAGLSGGIPALLKDGTPRHGVVVATEFLDSPEILGQVMAHEAGHALGLFHTVESETLYDEPVFDLVEDTEKGAGAEQNLMYFRITRNQELSLGQQRILAGHPVVGARQ